MDLRTRLEELMQEKKLNQRRLVALCNSTPPDDVVISASMISDILTGTSNKKAAGKQRGIDYQKIIKLARVLDCTVEYLVGYSDVRLSASDDVNNAAQTTGLSVACIEQLQEIRRGTCNTDNYVATVLEYLVNVSHNCMMGDIITMCGGYDKRDVKAAAETSITERNYETPAIYYSAKKEDVEKALASGKYKVLSDENNLTYLMHYICCVPVEATRRHDTTPPDYMHRYYQMKLVEETGKVISEQVGMIEYKAFLKEMGITKRKGAADGKHKKARQ